MENNQTRSVCYFCGNHNVDTNTQQYGNHHNACLEEYEKDMDKLDENASTAIYDFIKEKPIIEQCLIQLTDACYHNIHGVLTGAEFEAIYKFLSPERQKKFGRRFPNINGDKNQKELL